MVDRMCEKAKQGVQVRLLCDGFGSFLASDAPLQRIIEAGGNARRFKPMSHLSRLAYLNFRNHRKLLVVDGKRAILGSANLVEEEMSPHETDDSWIDLSLEIEGPAVAHLQAVFCSDWNFVTAENLPPSKVAGCEPVEGENPPGRLTVLPIGPDAPHEIVDDFWLLGLAQAERVWICTPYFVPPPHAVRALELACRRGLDVRIMVPNSSDLAPVDYARYDFFDDLQQVGAKILRYPEKMVHAKVGVLDDFVAFVGSANFDVRSFFLNYELSVAIHDRPTVDAIAKWYEDLVPHCERGLETRSAWRSTIATVTRVFASEL
ncbi:MAG: phospholipase D-like domain-containing protein [Pirellulaceae bacterium]